MSWTIGRAGTDITLPDPMTWSRGNTVRVTGYAQASTYADAVTLTEQLVGLAGNPDEPIVPCTWTLNAELDGYYRVANIDIGGGPESVVTFGFPYAVELERIRDAHMPVIESQLVGALMSNGLGAASGEAIWCYPEAAVDHYLAAFGTSTATRTSADGVIDFVYQSTYATAFSSFGQFTVAPASYYVGAATIEAGSTLRRVTGRRLKNLPMNWRLSNGLVRVTPASGGKLDVSHYDGAAWDTAIRYRLRLAAADWANGSSTQITVLRNSPEECVIRVATAPTGVTTNAIRSIDLSLKRGSRFVQVIMSNPTGREPGWGIKRDATEAATAITGGLRATANDASGNRYIIACNQSPTTDLVNGGVDASSSPVFMIGSEVGGSGAAARDAAAAVVNQFLFQISERQTVVAK